MEFMFGRIDKENNFVGISELHAYTISGIENEGISEIKDRILNYIGEDLKFKSGSNFKVNSGKTFPYFRKYQDLLALPDLTDGMDKTDIQVIVFLEDAYPDKIEPFLNEHHIDFTKSYGDFLLRPSFEFKGKNARIIIKLHIVNRNIFVFSICETELKGMFYPKLTKEKEFTDLNAMLSEISKYIRIENSAKGRFEFSSHTQLRKILFRLETLCQGTIL